jgi:diacylglycerol kinase
MIEQITKNRNWGDVFKNAFSGAVNALSSQKNFKIHLSVSFLVLVMGLWLKVSILEMAILVFAITLGLAIETINTAFEKTVDLVTSEYHPLAKAAKDISAGAMLIVSIGMAIIGILILFPPLWQKILG